MKTRMIACALAVAMGISFVASADEPTPTPTIRPGSVEEAAQRALEAQPTGNEAGQPTNDDLVIPEPITTRKDPWIITGSIFAGLGLGAAGVSLPIGLSAINDAGKCPNQACVDDAAGRKNTANYLLVGGLVAAGVGVAVDVIRGLKIRSHNIWVAELRARRFAKITPNNRSN